MTRVAGLVTIVVLLIVCEKADAAQREWSDSSGQFRVTAELLDVENELVRLRRSDGHLVDVPVDRLSTADQEYLRSIGKLSPSQSSEPQSSEPQSSELLNLESSISQGELRRYPEMGWPVKSLAFSPSGRFLAIGKQDRTIAVVDLVGNRPVSIHQHLRHLGQITALSFTPDGNKLISGGYSGQIQVWDVADDGQISPAGNFVGHGREITSLTVSADSKYVLSGSREEVHYWEVDTGRRKFHFDVLQRQARATYVTNSGKQGLISDGQTLVLLDLVQGEVLQAMTVGSGTGQFVAIAPDGSNVVVHDGRNMRMYSIRDGQELPVMHDNELLWTGSFTPNSRYVISGGRGKVNIWDAREQTKLYEIDLEAIGYVQTLAIAPDGRHLAAIPSSAGQTLQVFRLPEDVEAN